VVCFFWKGFLVIITEAHGVKLDVPCTLGFVRIRTTHTRNFKH
jgi:hypothetical protein